MTIFVVVIKKLLCDILEQVEKNSQHDDKSWYYGFGLLRNLPLAEEQRKISGKLREQIKSLKNKDSDYNTLLELKSLISKTNTYTEEVRKKYPEEKQVGNFCNVLSFLESDLSRIYNKLTKLGVKLLDVQQSEDPFTIFCEIALTYICEHNFWVREETIFKLGYVKCVSFFNSSEIDIRLIPQEKEKVLILGLKNCDKELKSIIRQIDFVLSKNANICSFNKPLVKLDISLIGFKVPFPDLFGEGRLKTLMMEGFERISLLELGTSIHDVFQEEEAFSSTVKELLKKLPRESSKTMPALF